MYPWSSKCSSEMAQVILAYARGKLGLTRLICLIDHDNIASIRVAEKMGMAFEKEGEDEIEPFLLYTRNFAGGVVKSKEVAIL